MTETADAIDLDLYPNEASDLAVVPGGLVAVANVPPCSRPAATWCTAGPAPGEWPRDVVRASRPDRAGPGGGGMGGDPAQVYAAAAVLDHYEHVEAAQEDGVDVGEVDREDRLGWPR